VVLQNQIPTLTQQRDLARQRVEELEEQPYATKWDLTTAQQRLRDVVEKLARYEASGPAQRMFISELIAAAGFERCSRCGGSGRIMEEER
jgi:septal ring factor EnvC (AmiA/AmiB activator)